MRGGRLLKQFTDLESISNLDMWQRCYTAEEIGSVVGLSKRHVDDEIRSLWEENGSFGKSLKVTFSEPDYAPPIYNVWASNHQSIPKRNNLSATRFQYFDRLTTQGIIPA
jgi:hypothetical protein